jgi:hypothetical protein
MSARPDQSGQAMTEMLVVSGALVAALLLPWLDGESPASWLLGALVGMSRSFQRWLFLL